MRYFFHIAYNGFNYHGWQRQPDVNSIQEVIETLLCRILKTDITALGCGRTDAQVHASQYFFHADVDSEWNEDMTFIVNKNLPEDISIFDVIPVGENQHARFDAIERTYNYFIHTYPDPFLSRTSALYRDRKLKLDEMNNAVALLREHKDYRNFCRKPTSHRTTVCDITTANLYIDTNGDCIRFELSANRFLNGMIRIIVQRLLMIGRGQMSVDEFRNILASNESFEIVNIAYPQGLYLSKIKYPYLDIPSRSTLFNALASRFALPYQNFY